MLDHVVRDVIVPLVLLLGLFGLVRYAVTGKGSGGSNIVAPASEEVIIEAE